MRLSDNLRQLPTICFAPPTPSAYGFRREPRPECYSTIEAIHQVIELFNDGAAAAAQPRRHDRLLAPFHFMVATPTRLHAVVIACIGAAALLRARVKRFFYRPRGKYKIMPVVPVGIWRGLIG